MAIKKFSSYNNITLYLPISSSCGILYTAVANHGRKKTKFKRV